MHSPIGASIPPALLSAAAPQTPLREHRSANAAAVWAAALPRQSLRTFYSAETLLQSRASGHLICHPASKPRLILHRGNFPPDSGTRPSHSALPAGTFAFGSGTSLRHERCRYQSHATQQHALHQHAPTDGRPPDTAAPPCDRQGRECPLGASVRPRPHAPRCRAHAKPRGNGAAPCCR